MVGTFDVANFGDLLFPEIAERELERRLGPVDLRRYAPRRMASPPWPYAVGSIDDLVGTLGEMDLLIVGGGHLVRFDHAVAPGYGATASAIPHPSGYWLSPTLAAAANGVPVAWNGLGASADTPAWARPLLAGALRAVDHVAVRDRASLSELAEVAPGVKIDLVPDSAFGIASVLASDPASLPTVLQGSPYVIVQASAGLRGLGDRLPLAIERAREAGRVVLELPISPVLGDRVGTLGRLGEVVTLDAWPPPLALAGIIAGAQAVVAQSMHLTIVAVAHGVPVVRRPGQPGTKYADLDGLPGVHLVRDGEDLGTLLASLTTSIASPRVLESVAQLEPHWDRIAGLVRDDGPAARDRRRGIASEILLELPAVLEAAESARSGAAEEAQSRAAADERHAADDQLHAADDRRREAEADQAIDRSNRLTEQVSALERDLQAMTAREREATQAVLDAARRTTALAERIGRLDTELTNERAQGAADRRRAEQDLARARARLKAAQAEANKARSKAASYDRLRSHRSFRAVIAAARQGRQAALALGFGKRLTVGEAPRGRQVAASEGEARALAAALVNEAPGSQRTTGPSVSIVILNRDGVDHLRRLIPAIAGTTYRAFDVIVVDNASGDGSIDELGAWAERLPLTVIRNTENLSFSDANNQAAAVATGTLLLFLNNDIEPVGPGWLGHLVDTLEAQEAAAVGARLIYPRRPGLENDGDQRFPDLTLQHRGVHFVAADGVPTGRNLGTGSDPRSEQAGHIGEATGVTAACLLIPRDVFTRVSGFTTGYAYGTEDVDLMMKVRAAGGRVVYDGGAVLWHHEYGTQNAQGREWKRSNRIRNRQRFVDRWGPQAFRTVLRDRVLGERRWSEAPLHVAVTLSKNDATAGWGDYYTAHELGDAFGGLGWQVSYVERYGDKWYDFDPTIDVVVSLLDSFDVRRVPRGIVTIAWIRNWTNRWVEHPWFDEYDVILASSPASQDIVASSSEHQAALMPLATNPERFRPGETAPELRSDVVFVGNRWGVARQIEEILPEIAADHRVRVFGRGWAESALAPFDEGPLEYDRLVDVYNSTTLVVDDTAGPTLPYGSVNSRVFDSLASGALVVSDNEVGVRELFGERFPVATDADQLRAVLDWIDREPGAAGELQASLREEVLERHTYRHRSEEVRDHLLRWVEADRYAILVGAPDWERAPSWGDYHFARGLQRQFEARGHPTRIHLLDDWGRSPSARADVAIHLHGLSDHRPRPSQFNILWVISHPDRVTAAMCDRYDLVFVASTAFASRLAAQARVPVMPLHQATDPERFHPAAGGPAHELLMVANTRGVRRSIIEDLTPTVHDLAIYGKGWTPDFVDPVHVRGERIPNRDLHRYYSAAGIVLNDHWPDMRSMGFLSNRLYDALASGAFVVSDAAVGIEDEFDGAVVTYADPQELRQIVDTYLADPAGRRALADRGREVVLARHTFAHRVDRDPEGGRGGRWCAPAGYRAVAGDRPLARPARDASRQSAARVGCPARGSRRTRLTPRRAAPEHKATGSGSVVAVHHRVAAPPRDEPAVDREGDDGRHGKGDRQARPEQAVEESRRHGSGDCQDDQRVDDLHRGDRERVRHDRDARRGAERHPRGEQDPHRERIAEGEGQDDGEHDRGDVLPAPPRGEDEAEHLTDRAAGEAMEGGVEGPPVERRRRGFHALNLAKASSGGGAATSTVRLTQASTDHAASSGQPADAVGPVHDRCSGHERHRSFRPDQALWPPRRRRRRVLLRRGGRDLRHPRPERRRQDDDRRIDRRPPDPRLRLDPGPGPRSPRRSRPSARRRRRPAPGERAAGPDHGPRGARPVRLVLRGTRGPPPADRRPRSHREARHRSSATSRAGRSSACRSPSPSSGSRGSRSSTSCRPASTRRRGAIRGTSSSRSAAVASPSSS